MVIEFQDEKFPSIKILLHPTNSGLDLQISEEDAISEQVNLTRSQVTELIGVLLHIQQKLRGNKNE